MQKLLLYVLFIYMPYCCYAQQVQVKGISRLLHLPLHEMRLDSLSAYISRETGVVFSFNAAKIDPAQKLSMPRMPVTVSELLTHLRNRYQLSFTVTGNYVILRNESPRQLLLPRQQPGSAATKAPRTVANKLQPHYAPRNKKAAVVIDSTQLPVQRIRLHEIYQLAPSAPVLLTATRIQPIATLSLPVTGSVAKIGLPKGSSRFFMATGIAADDAFYFSPGINAGFPWLYATGRWNTNFHVSGFSYGLGTSIR
ncbi:hypothetical protein, partial [Chitinophaga sp.]|uniref:hypothetical protein n=1 Tax=Chitinophaga sp. TaxID=1869181 RepID=UPI002F937615